jgi:subtilisin family serine protease
MPYGIKQVQADQLLPLMGTVQAGARKVCIIDSGYDGGHEDLSHGSLVTGDNDPTGAGNWNVDQNGHGTHVAGTIAAINAAGTGVVGVDGSGKLALHIIKVFGANGWAYSSSLTSAANLCKTRGAQVISMSLGGSVSNRTEQTAFDNLLKAGVLPIAAAGNAGNNRTSYPAGYASVMSVAAVDENKAWATFSQYNKDVEIAGPGVNVLSTVPMGTGVAPSLTVSATGYMPGSMEGSPLMSGTGELFDFGMGTGTNAAANDKVCLIQRGSVDFSTKVLNCQNSGGVGAVIYNNVAGEFAGTLGAVATTIPSVTVSAADGTALLQQVGLSATVAVGPSNYAYFDGTSMATPHVSAVAALVWSLRLNCTAADVRNALNLTATDLGARGRDTKFGFGLVQAKAAYDRMASNCGR